MKEEIKKLSDLFVCEQYVLSEDFIPIILLNCLIVWPWILFQGEAFSDVKDRIAKKLGLQDKEFEKVSIWVFKVNIMFV